MSEALLSIVIPVYNRAEVVTPTLESIAAQTYRPLHLILVDNNSTDSTRAVLDAWATAHSDDEFHVRVIGENTPGPGAARNAGLGVVNTPGTMVFDSDDLMAPDHCTRAMAAATATPEAQIVGWDLWLPGPGGIKRFRPFTTRDMVRANIFESLFSTLHYMARTELFRLAGGWDEVARVGEDVELGHRLLMLHPVCVRMPGHGETVTVVPEPLSLMRDGGGRLDRLEPALENIRVNLLPAKQHLIDLQYICAACGWAADDPDAPRKIAEIISRQPRARRLIFRMLYFYGRHGGRGIGRIYRLFSPQK